jgi:hypothetical protein
MKFVVSILVLKLSYANIVLSSTGATSVNITTPASGNSVANAALQNQTISFAALTPVTYGVTPFTLNASASSGLTLFTYSSSNPAVATVFGNAVTVVGAGSTIITASQAGDATYNPGSAQQTLVVNQKPITIANASASNKVYDGTNTAVLTGTLNGVETADAVNVSVALTGTFATVDVADGIAVTSTSTLSGTAATNYSLTQPTGLSANITIAPQAITFGAIADRTTADTTFNLFASASSTLPITYLSSNLSVATIVGNVVTIVGAGTTNITASQEGNSNYSAAVSVSQPLKVATAIAKWTFEGVALDGAEATIPSLTVGSSNVADLGSQTTDSAFDGLHAGAATWSTPAGNGSAKSLSSNVWAPGDYVQFKASASNFYNLSVMYEQTGSSTGPKEFKLQYSTDGTTFNDYGSIYNVVQGSYSSSSFSAAYRISHDLSNVPVLNNSNR